MRKHPSRHHSRHALRAALGLVLLGLSATLSAASMAPGSSADSRTVRPGEPTGEHLGRGTPGSDPEAVLERVRLEEELIQSDRTATMLGEWIAVREQRVLAR